MDSTQSEKELYETAVCYFHNNVRHDINNKLFLEEKKFSKEGFINKFTICYLIIEVLVSLISLGASAGRIDILLLIFISASIQWFILTLIFVLVIEAIFGTKRVYFTQEELDTLLKKYNALKNKVK